MLNTSDNKVPVLAKRSVDLSWSNPGLNRSNKITCDILQDCSKEGTKKVYLLSIYLLSLSRGVCQSSKLERVYRVKQYFLINIFRSIVIGYLSFYFINDNIFY